MYTKLQEVARLFYGSYIAGQSDADALKGIEELLEHVPDIMDVVHGLALYHVAGEMLPGEDADEKWEQTKRNAAAFNAESMKSLIRFVEPEEMHNWPKRSDNE